MTGLFIHGLELLLHIKVSVRSKISVESLILSRIKGLLLISLPRISKMFVLYAYYIYIYIYIYIYNYGQQKCLIINICKI